jgi:c-di-GMP-binding flagellar brake protein YcgR
MINLNKLLAQQPHSPEKVGRERRAYERHNLTGAFAKLNYQGTSFRCRLLDISMGGCRLETESPFRDGAIANVEVDMSVFGLNLKICGVTQWSATSRQIGVRFIHPGVRTKNQVANIISCVIDESARDAVREALEAEAADQTTPQAPVYSEPAFEPVSSSMAAVLAVHGEHRRVTRPGSEDWPTSVRDMKAERQSTGSITELSMGGCCVLLVNPFVGELHHEVEVEFEILRLHFRLAGMPRAVHDRHLVGIEFKPMSNRRIDELTQLIFELTPRD